MCTYFREETISRVNSINKLQHKKQIKWDR